MPLAHKERKSGCLKRRRVLTINKRRPPVISVVIRNGQGEVISRQASAFPLLKGSSALMTAIDAARLFIALKNEWLEATAHHSSIEIITSHPAYLKIIGLGADALPYIFADLLESTNHWFVALNAITRENPVPARHRGNMEKMAEAWVKWGIKNKYLPKSEKSMRRSFQT